MANPKWTFQRTSPMGGATGEAFVNTLYGTGMPPAAVLAREAIQNSSDAAKAPGEKKVRVVFRRVTLEGNAKAGFIKTLHLQENFAPRRRELEVQKGSCLEKLSDTSKPLRLLYIRTTKHMAFTATHTTMGRIFFGSSSPWETARRPEKAAARADRMATARRCTRRTAVSTRSSR